jgi:hypothetical protein
MARPNKQMSFNWIPNITLLKHLRWVFDKDVVKKNFNPFYSATPEIIWL